METTNGWISMDIGWIWVGYIQDGLLVPFGPSVIAIRGSWGLEMALKCYKMGILSGPCGSKCLELNGSMLDLG